MRHVSRTVRAGTWFGGVAAVPLATFLAGCSPAGEGTIEVDSPQAVRAKVEGGPPADKAVSEKQAAALKLEEAAAKKHPKLN